MSKNNLLVFAVKAFHLEKSRFWLLNDITFRQINHLHFLNFDLLQPNTLGLDYMVTVLTFQP